ncbi:MULTISPECIES: Gfo/Idh/MocA family protein [Paenibacillus]|uniref:Oxidoreductase YulF n=1 Tax=Paenibacillus vini TaxID=1476024 RepID=A0ABQ4MAV7_9BACL|nr:Gfo/Idh/MocA family oxidoreductase [Paenibacillus vini]MBQ4900200.1 Gfo/Idh/MocA family oxidoreductase [Paenibacillus sp. Marseille-P2973]MDN4066541.1 Gfo/Idh/MocA family oxidoreductase [Paenibacillus vini]GIP53094.1 putative oxidoreductase YulF [Paenibacillus vini]
MLRFGVIGTNWITERFIQAAEETEHFNLAAVYSRSEEKGKAFAAKYNSNPSVYTDLEQMVSGDVVDAVYIASPNSLHAEQAILCMNHGKHVLCEKPLASNVAETQRMIQAARDNDVLLMEAMKSTLMPNFRVITNNLYKIGRVRRYFASYCQYSSRYDAFKQGNVLNAFNPEFSNGALMDLGIYCIYPLVTLFGKPEAVQATSIMLSSGVDGEGSILMRYEDMDAVVMYSKIADSYAPAEIQGENGTLIIDKVNQPYDVKILYRDGTVEDLRQPQMQESMFYEAREFIELVESGKRDSSVNSLANSLIVAEIMEEARRQIGLKFPADSF